MFGIQLIAFLGGQVALGLVKTCLLHDDHELIEVNLLAAVELVRTRIADLEHQLECIIATVKPYVIPDRLHVIQSDRTAIIVIIHLEGILEQLSHVSLVSLGYESRHEDPELLLVN